MTRPAAVVTLLAVLALAGCGSAEDGQPTRQQGTLPALQEPGPRPVWPGLGCGSRAVGSVAYVSTPTGEVSPEEAVDGTSVPGLPDGVVKPAPSSGKGPLLFWIVDPETDEVHAEVSVHRGPDGWFVSGVMTCPA